MLKITCASMKQNHGKFLNKTYGSKITYKNIKIQLMFLKMIYSKKCKIITMNLTTGKILINTNIGKNLQKDGKSIDSTLKIDTKRMVFQNCYLLLINPECIENV